MVDKGLTDQLKGKTKEIVGDLTGDTVTKAEGWLEQGVGKTKRRLRMLQISLKKYRKKQQRNLIKSEKNESKRVVATLFP